MSTDRANRQLQHEIDIKVITDGEHHVLDRLDAPCEDCSDGITGKKVETPWF